MSDDRKVGTVGRVVGAMTIFVVGSAALWGLLAVAERRFGERQVEIVFGTVGVVFVVWIWHMYGRLKKQGRL